MPTSVRPLLCFFTALASLTLGSAKAAELRTYRFNSSGSLPYSSSCGECSRYLSVVADVSGYFTVSIDPVLGRGELQELEVELTDAYELVLGNSGGPSPSFEPIDLDVYGRGIGFGWILGEKPWAGDLVLNDTGGYDLRSDVVPLELNGFSVLLLHDSAVLSINETAVDYSHALADVRATLVPEPRVAGEIWLAMLALGSRFNRCRAASWSRHSACY